MIKNTAAALVLLLCFAACRSPQQRESPAPPPVVEAENLFFSAPVSPGDLIFYGTAGIQSKQEAAVRLALEDAARKVAFFYSVEGRLHSHVSGTGFLDYRSEMETALSYDEDYIRFVDDLVFDPGTDVLQSGNALFVRARYPAAQVRTPSLPGGGGLRPGWIDNPPEAIDGYTAGIGYAGRRSSHSDTVRSSYENAVFAIIKNRYGSARGGIQDVQGEGVFGASQDLSGELSAAGVLHGFYALEIWVDPASKAVWTLAVVQ